MRRGRGVQAEVLASLVVVMVTATALLAAMLVRTQSRQIESLRSLIGHALVAVANDATLRWVGGSENVLWWLVAPDSVVRFGDHGYEVDAEGLALVEEALATGNPLVRVGRPWQPTRFAMVVDDDDRVALAYIAPVASGAFIVWVVVGNCVVFVAFGGYLLRGRVVLPMRRLAHSAMAIAGGSRGLRVAVEGDGEAAEVARAFNAMTEALERRGDELEKAVAELRRTNRDLSRARDGLDRAERLATVGSLAAGVAHEVGNPMGALLAFLELARRDPTLSETGGAHLDRAVEQGERVREILRQLLDFSRPPRVTSGAVDLRELIDETISLVHAQTRYAEIDFAVDLGGGVGAVHGDRSMLSQILLNLLINAADASLDGEGPPRVRVCVAEAPLQIRADEGREDAGGRRSVDGIECLVADSGPGVVGDNRERIFDPFFTTKDPGEGTGLGLANSLRLAEEQGGVVELCEQGPLEGAAFALRLPKHAETLAATATATQDSPPQVRSRG